MASRPFSAAGGNFANQPVTTGADREGKAINARALFLDDHDGQPELRRTTGAFLGLTLRCEGAHANAVKSTRTGFHRIDRDVGVISAEARAQPFGICRMRERSALAEAGLAADQPSPVVRPA